MRLGSWRSQPDLRESSPLVKRNSPSGGVERNFAGGVGVVVNLEVFVGGLVVEVVEEVVIGLGGRCGFGRSGEFLDRGLVGGFR